jgi:hypothetical protein
MYNAFTKMKPREVVVKDYMPKKPMVKIFDGGFENAGYVEVIDEIKGEFYQKKTMDSATMGVAVYRVTNEKGYRLVYREGETNKFKDDYIDEKSNIDLVLLRVPMKKGVSWINDDGSTYKILSTDEKIEVQGKEIEAIKLRYRKDGYEYYVYIGKGLGIVGMDSEMGNSRLIEVNYDVEKYLNKSKK